MPGNTKATFTFSVPSGNGGSAITGYRAACNPGNIFVVGAGSPIVLNGLVNMTTYDCTVSAINAAGSTPSASVAVTPSTDPVPPVFTSPNSLAFIVGNPGTLTVSAAGTPTPTLSLNSTLPNGVTFNPVTGVLAGTPILGTVGTYALALIASNGSLPNAVQPFTLSVAKTSQSITFPFIANQTFGSAQVPILATASSGLAVAFSSLTTGTCTVNGSNVSLNNPGFCTIAANQAGDANYSAASQSTQSFFINSASGNAGSGANYWANGNGPQFQPCRNCHGFSPNGNVLNAANAPSLIAFVFNTNFLGLHLPTPGPNVFQQQDLAAYIGTFVPGTNPVGRPVTFNQPAFFTIPNLFFGTGTLGGISMVTPPAKGSVSFGGSNVTYTPFAGRTGSDGFSFRGAGAAGQTEIRTATVFIGNPPFPVISSGGTASGVTGTAFSYAITATNTPQSYGASGLPPGLAVNTSTGQIYGIPTALGSYPGTVSATNAGGTGPLAVTFNISGLQLVVSRSGTGAGTVVSAPAGVNCGATCALEFNFGTVVTLTASPSSGSNFTGWSGGGCSGSGTCIVTMNTATPVTATFTLITPPGAPMGATATPGNGQATISFMPPASNGGGAITLYTSTCTASGQTTRIDNAGTSPIVATGLTNGVQYSCAVTATNSAGAGAAATVLVTPRTVPDAPMIGPATPGDAQASIAFTVPAFNGGANITAYTAICTSMTQPTRSASAASSPIVVTSMVNGSAYSCSVTATNPAGTGAASGTVAVTPRTVPGAPTAPIGTVYDSRAIVSFIPPVSDGGSAITGYTVSCNGNSINVSGGASPITLTGLTNGVTYTCTVAANNAAGSAPSTSFSFVPAVKTGGVLWTAICTSCHTPVPSGAQLNGAGPSIVPLNYVIATQPLMLANSSVQALTTAERIAIADYILTQVPSAVETTPFNTPKSIDLSNRITIGGVAFESIKPGMSAPARGTLSTITGSSVTYTPFAAYVGSDSFTVTGSHDSMPAFLGSEITVNVTVQPPPAPVISSSLMAAGTNGSPFNYQITATSSPTGYDALMLPAGLGVNMSTGLISGTPMVGGTFPVTISASNAGGPGSATLTISLNPASQAIMFPSQSPATRSFVPSPMNVFAINPLASATSGLTVSYLSKTPSVCTTSGTNVSMLSAGTCTLGANQAGDANYTVATEVTQDVTITPTVPGAPTIGMPTGGNNQATIAFSAPANTGGTAITLYTANCTPTGSGTNAVSPIVVNGLVNNTVYTCSVKATNSVGQGLASGTVMVTPVATPTPPAITSANATTFTVNAPGSFAVTATGTPSVFTYSVTGTLPMGVSFSTSTGVLSGTPTQAGPFPLTFGVSNTVLPNASQGFTLTVSNANQSITFGNPGTQVFSPSLVSLSAVATSSLAVSFVSDTTGVCTIVGTNATLVSVGTCTIRAQQSGNANFNAAADVSQSFSVVQGGQLITFGAQTSPRAFVLNFMFALSPTASASSGLTVAYTSLTTGVCTIASTTVTMVRAGICTIAANQSGSASYSAAAQVTQSITLTGSAPGAPVIGTATGGDTKITVTFTAPASDGGSSITGYTVTCGSATQGGAASPISVTGLTNGMSYSCSVTATNAINTGPASGSLMATPNALPGAAKWAATCGTGGCHGNPPVGTRLNVGGSTAAVLDYVVANPTMAMNIMVFIVNGFTAQEKIDVANYIRDFIPAVSATTPVGTSVMIDVGSQVFLNTPSAALTSLQQVSAPANGTLSAFTGTTVTYTPNAGFTGTNTFTYRATQAGLNTDIRTVTVTVTPAAPVITSALIATGTVNQAFNYQIAATNAPSSYNATGLPTGLGINMVTGAITGMASAAGPSMVTISAMNAGGTGNATLALTINLIPQTITFGAQASPLTYSQGSTVMIAPPASGGASGSAIVYSSTTSGVCTVSGATFTMVTAGICTIAANQAGNATYAAAAQATQSVSITGIAPAAPTIGTAVAGNTQATINFTPPSNTGGLPITNYTVNCSGFAQSGPNSPIVVSGLTNGVTYTCTVQATSLGGTSPVSGAVMVTPVAIAFTNQVYSRKTHAGAVGDKDLPLNYPAVIGGAFTVEPRAIGAGHRIVFVFNNPVSSVTSLSVMDANMMPVGSAAASFNVNELIVSITGVPDNQRVTVSANGVNGALNVSVAVGFLIGDANSNGRVNASDVSAVKARVGQPVNMGNNYLFDVGTNGTITNADVSAVKARSGLAIP